MSETTNPLAPIERLEARAFRAGQVARRLLAEEPGQWELRTAIAYGRHNGVDPVPTLELQFPSADALRAWAEAHEVSLETKVLGGAYEHTAATAEIDGVDVRAYAMRPLTQDEAGKDTPDQGAAFTQPEAGAGSAGGEQR